LNGRAGKALISVHRGLWGADPENSSNAVSAAESIGIVEIDLQLAADGVPVVFHDDVLERMTGETGRLADRTSGELSTLCLRVGDGGPDAVLTDQCIPMLADVLGQAVSGSYFDFDIKRADQVEPIAAEILRLGGQRLGSIKVDTETVADIETLLSLQARYGIMVMAKVVLPRAGMDHIADLVRAGVAAVEVWFSSLDELAEACRLAGDDMAISTYTLDPVHCSGLSDSIAATDPAHVWGQLIDAGVDIIMTDRAAELARFQELRFSKYR